MFVLFIFRCPVSLNAQVQVEKSYADSLCRMLQEAGTSAARINALKQLSTLYWQLPESVYYLKEVMHEAMLADSSDVAYNAMSSLCRYYFNLGVSDSVLYWRNRIDSISHSKGEYPDDLFTAGNLVCKNYLEFDNYELAMNEAISQLNKAKEVGQVFGMLKANESLGVIYTEINRDSDAVVAFRVGLDLLDKSTNWESFKMQYLSEMIIPCLRLNYFDESEKLLKLYLALLENVEQSFKDKGLKFPVQWHRWWINSFYSELYSRQNQLDKAKSYLNEAAFYADESSDEEMKLPYYWAQIHYYTKTKNSLLALEAVNKALAYEPLVDLLKIKVDLLRDLARPEEAILVYDKLLAMSTAASNEAFSRQINQLRTLNDLNDQSKQLSELQYQNEQISEKQRLLVISILVAVALLILLSVLYRFYRRSCRLKNELQSEKDLLVESDIELRIAKEKAEKSNQLKTEFLSSISHEVRTPLNAIVGFSELLTDEEYEDEDKIEFAAMINTNSELLMKLVNDVLDLSRLESGNSRFVIRPNDIIVCCQNAIAAVEQRVAPGVKLTFTTPVSTCILATDSSRLQQLLTNLLTNAAKFTLQGEINLSIEMDEADQRILFSVQDTGCGIPTEKQHAIFEHFEKLDEFVQGTGLGLSICKMIARQLNASLYLDSDYTAGARFVFVHPCNLAC